METELTACILIKLYFDWLNDWKWLAMVCVTCQHLHVATSKMSLMLLCKSHKAGWGFFPTSLRSEQLLKYPTTLFYDRGKNMPSFFQHNRRQHKTPCKPRWIQVSACTNTTKPNKKISKHFESCSIKHTQASKWKLWPLQKGQRESWEPMQCCN